MHRFLPAIALLLLSAAFVSTREEAPPFYLGGIQVNEPDHAAWVRELERSGMNTVAVTVYAKQGDWDSSNLWFEEEEPWVVAEARQARARGLSVVLVLRVALDHAFPRNRYLWHGMIMPRDDADLEEWFDRYERFARKWALVAEREGIGVLAVGSELNALTNTVPVDELPALEEYWSNPEKVARETGRILSAAGEEGARRPGVPGGDAHESLDRYLDERHAAHAGWAFQVTARSEPDAIDRINRRRRLLEDGWRRVIRSVREVYGGELTYAANFDQFEFVSFWSALDLIGVNAYFPLVRRVLPELDEAELLPLLEARWRSILSSLDALRRRHGVPGHRVLFTELGYVQRARATLEPWSSEGFSLLPSAQGPRLVVWRDQPPEPRERALAVRALGRAHRAFGDGLLAGVLYWKLSTLPSHRAVEPFVVILGDGKPEDPIVTEMRRLLPRGRLDRWLASLAGLLPLRHPFDERPAAGGRTAGPPAAPLSQSELEETP